MTKYSNKQQRGQFFTVDPRVQKLMGSLLLKKEFGEEPLTALEPSAGTGDLVKVLEQIDKDYSIDAVELDSNLTKVCETSIVYQDFFAFANGKSEKYDVILGNPPYVSWKKVEASTHFTAAGIKARYSDKTNLYHLFIDRCIDLLAPEGEMVLIIPKEWLYTTSASPLREKISEKGAITHYIDCGEEKLFPDADVPALVIIRFVKNGNIDKTVLTALSLNEALSDNYIDKKIVSAGSRWIIIDEKQSKKAENYIKLSDVFSVKVGIVSGADPIYRANEDKINNKNLEAETIKKYITTKGEEDFIDVNDYDNFNDIPENTRKYLLENKGSLINRGIKKFNENNWWHYGAIRNKKAMENENNWISVEARTRRLSPFVVQTKPALYSGGILGLYPIEKTPIDIVEKYAVFFNSDDFKEILRGMFIMSNNKASMQPATLHDALIPDFRKE